MSAHDLPTITITAKEHAGVMGRTRRRTSPMFILAGGAPASFVLDPQIRAMTDAFERADLGLDAARWLPAVAAFNELLAQVVDVQARTCVCDGLVVQITYAHSSSHLQSLEWTL